MENSVPKGQQRVFVFEAIYADLIFSKNNTNMYDNIYNLGIWSNFEKQIYENYINNKKKYLNEIKDLLDKNGTIDRLNIPSLALILEAISEFNIFGTNYKVLIQQSIITCKKYCDDNEYKFVNAILDNYLSLKC